MLQKSLSFFTKAFAALALTLSGHLGDRSTYVGASDLAGCPRKAALSKIPPAKPRPIHEQLVMALGHAIEDLIAKLFTAGGFTGFQREIEVAHPELPWFKCHLDFFAKTKNGIRVIELKSSKGIPDEPRPTWEKQHYAQLGLTALNHPGEAISGSIMVVDRVCGHMAEFNSYTPDNDVFNYMVEKAKAIWDAVQGGPIPEPEPGFLCGYCPFKEDCPAHLAEAKKNEELKQLPEEVAKAVLTYAGLKEHRDKLEKEMDKAKAMILEFAGQKARGRAGSNYVLNVYTTAEGTMVDSKKLKAKYPDVYAECSKAKAGQTRVEVKQITETLAAE